MESNNFDKQIRDKLQNLKADYRPEDWELMEQKLTDADASVKPEFDDVLLDGMAFSSLENYKADFNPDHWHLMEQKLDGVYPIRRKLYRYKVAEIGLMLLALITIIQFLPFKKQKSNKAIAVIEKQVEVNNSDLSTSEVVAETAERSTETEEEIPAENIAPSNTVLPPTTDNNNQSGINYAENSPVSNAGIGLTLDKLSNRDVLTQRNLETRNFAHNSSELAMANSVQQGKNDYQSVLLLLPIETYQPEQLNTKSTSRLPDCPVCETYRSPILLSVGMVGGANIDYIKTPFDDQYYQKEFGQYAMGYSGGVTFGIRYHKWEFETGAIYAAKYYGSRNVFEVNGSFETGGYVQQGLMGVQLDIVKVPIHLRYNFMHQSKWNIYAHSGASFNMTIETLYEYTTHSIGNSALASRQAEPPHPEKSYDGIFEGGNLIDNTFITANLGLGIERQFNSRMSIFLGSTYQHQVTKGLGPQNDKINSLSIMTGARVTLRSKKKY